MAVAALAYASIAGWVASSKGPYMAHVDEQHITGNAFGMLERGDLDPGFYRYGNWPIYLGLVGETVGLQAARLTTPELDEPRAAFPTSRPPAMVSTARALFVGVGLLCAVLAALIASLVAGNAWAGAVSAVLLLANPIVATSAYGYMNVDVCGSLALLGATLALLRHGDDESMWRRAVLPGALIGAAAAAKYSLGATAVVILVNELRVRKQPLPALVGAGLACALAFAVLCPYAWLNAEGLLEALEYESRHYQSGHTGHQGTPGLTQLLAYLGEWAGALPQAVPLVVVGVVAAARANRGRTLAVLVIPAVLLTLLSLQKVIFHRNALFIHYLLTAFAASGAIVSLRWLQGWLSDRWNVLTTRAALAVLAAAVLLPGVPFLLDQLSRPTDSRDQLTAHITELGPDAIVAVHRSLHMPEVGGDGRRQVVVGAWQSAALATELARAGATHVAYPARITRAPWRRKRGPKPPRLEAAGQVVLKAGAGPTWNHAPWLPRGDPALVLVRLEPGNAQPAPNPH